MKVSVAKKWLDKYPQLRVHLVVARGVNVQTSKSREIINLLRAEEDALRREYSAESIMDEPRVSMMVDAYQTIMEESEMPSKMAKKINPSHVAMAKRVLDDNKLPNINPLVNFYNAISLRYLVSVGAENLKQYYGDLELGVTTGDEYFRAIGNDKADTIYKGEIGWIDDAGISCRMWGWRQCERTMVDKDTKDILFFIDGVTDLEKGGSGSDWQAAQEIARGLEEYFGVESEVFTLDFDNPVVDIGYQSKKYDPEEFKVEESKESEEVEKGTKGIRKRKPISLGFQSDSTFLNMIEKDLKRLLSEDVGELGLNYSPDGQFGELSSNVSFRLAPIRKEPPQKAGKWLVEQLLAGGAQEKGFTFEVADNGFVNIHLSDELMVKYLDEAVKAGEEFGKFDVGKDKSILVESPGWNPNKTPHVGHMLNLFLGKAIIRLFEQVGMEADNDDIINDKGLPVMQTIWAYLKYGDGTTPESTGDKADHFVQRYYVLGKKKFEESKDVEKEVRSILRKWEAGDQEIVDVWKQLVSWSYKGQRETIERVWEEPGYAWYESDVYQGGKEIVLDELEKGSDVLEKLDDGAVIAKIEQEYGLPDAVLLKSDGTGLYHTQDIFLTLKKKEKFDPWRMTWVVAEEQIVHFQRLFAVLDALDIMPIDNLYHYAYSWVVGKDGKKLSSRDGSELSADEMMDMMHDAAKEVLIERGVEDEEIDMEEVAEVVGLGALKYALLSRDPFKKIKFDLNKAIAFQGKSGPYIMYTYTRAQSVLRKLESVGADEGRGADGSGDAATAELDERVSKLVVQMLRYPEVVLASANNYSPGILAEYLFDLAKSFNNFYENVQVIGSSPEKLSVYEDVLKLYSHVSKDGLGLLGIKVLERM
jgi:arginyl-tRNA synthetase